MGDGHGLSADEIKKKYKGYKELGELLRDLVKASPPWQVRAQGHGVRIYCPCGDPEHTLSVPKRPARRRERREARPPVRGALPLLRV